MWWLLPSVALSTILLFPNVVIIYKVSLFKIENLVHLGGNPSPALHFTPAVSR